MTELPEHLKHQCDIEGLSHDSIKIVDGVPRCCDTCKHAHEEALVRFVRCDKEDIYFQRICCCQGYEQRQDEPDELSESDKIDISCSIGMLITRLQKVVSNLGAAQNAIQHYTDRTTAAKCLTDAAYYLKDCTAKEVEALATKVILSKTKSND